MDPSFQTFLAGELKSIRDQGLYKAGEARLERAVAAFTKVGRALGVLAA